MNVVSDVAQESGKHLNVKPPRGNSNPLEALPGHSTKTLRQSISVLDHVAASLNVAITPVKTFVTVVHAEAAKKQSLTIFLAAVAELFSKHHCHAVPNLHLVTFHAPNRRI